MNSENNNFEELLERNQIRIDVLEYVIVKLIDSNYLEETSNWIEETCNWIDELYDKKRRLEKKMR